MAVTIDRYDVPYLVSQYYLDLLGIDRFPVDLFYVIDELNRCKPFNIFIQKHSEYIHYRKETDDTRNEIHINDGRCYKSISKNGRATYLIIYNDSKPLQRIRFTIAHELGHILLGHLENGVTEIDRGGISNSLYMELENQADVFAGNFLVPPILLNERLKMLNCRDIPFIISDTFDISKPAVFNRYKDLDVWRMQNRINQYERNIFNRCKDSVCFVTCRICGAEIGVDNAATFDIKSLNCKYCGNKQFGYFRSQKNMVYEGIEMDSNNKALVCPVCKNEHIVENGEFCKICGTKLINECMESYNPERDDFKPSCEKGKRLDGSSRFCPYCGNPSSFLQNGILNPVLPPPPSASLFRTFETSNDPF